MTSFGSLMTGTFVGTTAPFNISLPPGYDEFEMVNITDIGSSASATPVMKARGTSAMAAGSAYYSTKTNGASTLDLEKTTTTGGFTIVPDSGHYPLGASIVTTAVSQAAPGVVSTGTTTGLIAGSSVVRMYNVAGMQQVSGMDFTVGTVVGSTSFTLAYLDTSAFLAAGTTGSYRVVPFPNNYFFPKRNYITNISQATQAIVTLSVTNKYVVGEYIRMIVPNGFGMTQMNGLLAQIVAVGATDGSGFTNTVTINVDSSAFTAFAWPASGAVPITFAQTVDVGETATILTQAEVNTSFTGVQVGSTVMTSGKTYQWFARDGANFGLLTSL
jgi:hypothetical protein